jgi:cell division protein FtsL
MVVAAVVVVVGTIFVIGMGQNMLGTQQIRLDTLQQELASATQTNQNLLLSRAQLEAPARILQLAQQRLGMVTPRNVIYLTPVTTGPTVAEKTKESIGASR